MIFCCLRRIGSGGWEMLAATSLSRWRPAPGLTKTLLARVGLIISPGRCYVEYCRAYDSFAAGVADWYALIKDLYHPQPELDDTGHDPAALCATGGW